MAFLLELRVWDFFLKTRGGDSFSSGIWEDSFLEPGYEPFESFSSLLIWEIVSSSSIKDKSGVAFV